MGEPPIAVDVCNRRENMSVEALLEVVFTRDGYHDILPFLPPKQLEIVTAPHNSKYPGCNNGKAGGLRWRLLGQTSDCCTKAMQDVGLWTR